MSISPSFMIITHLCPVLCHLTTPPASSVAWCYVVIIYAGPCCVKPANFPRLKQLAVPAVLAASQSNTLRMRTTTDGTDCACVEHLTCTSAEEISCGDPTSSSKSDSGQLLAWLSETRAVVKKDSIFSRV